MPEGLYFKTLRIRNLWETDIFRGKLVSSGMDKHANMDKHDILDKHACLDKHASLVKHTIFNKQTHQLTTESVHYKSVMVL